MSGKRWPGWAVGWAWLWAGLGQGQGHWGPDGDTGTWTQEWGHSGTGADWARNADHGFWIELQTNYRRSFHNHGEGPYWCILLVESAY